MQNLMREQLKVGILPPNVVPMVQTLKKEAVKDGRISSKGSMVLRLTMEVQKTTRVVQKLINKMEALIHGILPIEVPAVQNLTVTSATEGNHPSKGIVVKKLTMEVVKNGSHPPKVVKECVEEQKIIFQRSRGTENLEGGVEDLNDGTLLF